MVGGRTDNAVKNRWVPVWLRGRGAGGMQAASCVADACQFVHNRRQQLSLAGGGCRVPALPPAPFQPPALAYPCRGGV